MPHKAIKYRLYPTDKQAEYFNKNFGCCRKLWNLMLADKIAYYEKTKKQLKTKPTDYYNDYPFFREVDSLALSSVNANLNKAYNDFFSSLKGGKKKKGFPKFKSAKRSRRSYKTSNQGTTVRLTDNSIKLPKIGFIKAKIHRRPEPDWRLLSATISQDPDGKYYVSVCFECPEPNITQVPVTEDKAIGLDYKSDGLYTDSNGKTAGSPKYYRKTQKDLAKLQRQLSRKKKDSNNYNKARLRVARKHKHIANKRLDYLHKKSTEITNQYDTICVETLNMRTMANKGFHNGKATLDNGYGIFLKLLEYKLKDRGKHFVKVDKWFPSSQLCYCCGTQHKSMKNLSQRIFVCSCGYKNDRDINAAMNIKKEGLQLLTISAVA